MDMSLPDIDSLPALLRAEARRRVTGAITHLSWDVDDTATMDAIRLLTRALERI
jgi:hypothetical protein